MLLLLPCVPLGVSCIKSFSKPPYITLQLAWVKPSDFTHLMIINNKMRVGGAQGLVARHARGLCLEGGLHGAGGDAVAQAGVAGGRLRAPKGQAALAAQHTRVRHAARRAGRLRVVAPHLDEARAARQRPARAGLDLSALLQVFMGKPNRSATPLPSLLRHSYIQHSCQSPATRMVSGKPKPMVPQKMGIQSPT